MKRSAELEIFDGLAVQPAGQFDAGERHGRGRLLERGVRSMQVDGHVVSGPADRERIHVVQSGHLQE